MVENLEVSLRSEKLLELGDDWLISLPIFSTCWSFPGFTSFLEKPHSSFEFDWLDCLLCFSSEISRVMPCLKTRERCLKAPLSSSALTEVAFVRSSTGCCWRRIGKSPANSYLARQRLEACFTSSNSNKEEFDGKGKARWSTPTSAFRNEVRTMTSSPTVEDPFQMWQLVRNGVHPPKHTAHPVRPPKVPQWCRCFENQHELGCAYRAPPHRTSKIAGTKAIVIRSLYQSVKECQKQHLKVEKKGNEKQPRGQHKNQPPRMLGIKAIPFVFVNWSCRKRKRWRRRCFPSRKQWYMLFGMWNDIPDATVSAWERNPSTHWGCSFQNNLHRWLPSRIRTHVSDTPWTSWMPW